MEYVVFETIFNQVYTGDTRDRDELSPMGRDAKLLNMAQAEALVEVLNRQYGYRYSFRVISKNSLPL